MTEIQTVADPIFIAYEQLTDADIEDSAVILNLQHSCEVRVELDDEDEKLVIVSPPMVMDLEVLRRFKDYELVIALDNAGFSMAVSLVPMIVEAGVANATILNVTEGSELAVTRLGRQVGKFKNLPDEVMH